MPPKGAKKKAPTASAKLAAEDAQIDERLAKIDLWVDDMKHEINEMMEAAVEEMQHDIRNMLLGVKPSILEMKMGDFLRECGGSFQMAYDKERKMARLARTTKEAAASSSTARFGTTILKGTARVARVHLPLPAPSASSAAMPSAAAAAAAALMDDSESLDMPSAATATDASSSSAATSVVAPKAVPVYPSAATSSSASVSASTAAALPLRTPGGPTAYRSRVGPMVAAPATAAELPTRTPAMTTMKSAVPQISGFLPKTPAVDKAKRPRTKRRNEMVYHVSENGSPIQVDSSAAAASAVAAPAVSVSLAGPIQVALGDKAVSLNDISCTDQAEAQKLLAAFAAAEAQFAAAKKALEAQLLGSGAGPKLATGL